jgi:cell division protein FtsB
MWTLLRLNLKTSQYQQISNELKTLKNQNETLKKTIDTLNDELFKKEIELFRRERAYEIFEERYPVAASEFNDIIADETE